MKILIIEDENPAASRLKKLILKLEPDAEILDVIDSVEESIKWLSHFDHPDIIFMDIQLADGLSFEIFDSVEITSTIIFTTAFDQYAIQAFRVNGMDYLLKPINPEHLQQALNRYNSNNQKQEVIDYSELLTSVLHKSPNNYKERFLIKLGEQLIHVSVDDIAYFYADQGVIKLKTYKGKNLIVDFTLDQLVNTLNPKTFFRINRKQIIHINSLSRTNSWFNSRLKLELNPIPEFEVVVSRERVSDFKNWLDS